MLEQFNDVGFVRIEGAFSGDEAAAMREVIWRALDDIHGIREDDPTTWMIERVTKLQPIKSDPVFALIGGARTRAAIDALLVEWDVPRQWGGFLVSFPRHGATWTVPSGEWHPDYHFYYPSTPLFGLEVFSYITDVAPGGGATVVVSRSHTLIDRFVGGRSPEELRDFAGMKQAFHRTHPWLQELTEGDLTNDRRGPIHARRSSNRRCGRACRRTHRQRRRRRADALLAAAFLRAKSRQRPPLHARAQPLPEGFGLTIGDTGGTWGHRIGFWQRTGC